MAKGWKVGPKGGKLDQRVESWTKGWKVGPKGGKLDQRVESWTKGWKVGKVEVLLCDEKISHVPL